MRTQWHTDFGVRTGMNYLVLNARLDHLQRRLGLSDQARDELENDLRHMESAALVAMAETE